MISDHDPDSLATHARAARRHTRRARQAGRVLAQAAWVDALLVFWTGQCEAVPRLAGAVAPMRAVLQERLKALPAGLYAIRFGDANPPPAKPAPPGRTTRAARPVDGSLEIAIAAADEVTRERIADTARAIEAAASYPRAGTRFVGPIDEWRRKALARLDSHRHALEGADAWRTGASRALALEARALWLGTDPPASAALPERALSSWVTGSPDRDDLAARLAAVELGRRHAPAARQTALSAWCAIGSAFDRWPAAAIARAAAAVGTTTLVASAAAFPALNAGIAAGWFEERLIDGALPTSGELADLARLLDVLAAVDAEPARRHATLGRLAVQHLLLGRAGSRPPGPGAWPDAAGAFRRLALDLAYGEVREAALARACPVPDSLLALVARWVGDPLLDGGSYAYLEHLLADAAAELGLSEAVSFYRDPRRDVLQARTAGAARDPAGPTAVVAVACGLQRTGATHACRLMADWLEACRTVVPLGSFWPDVLAVVPSVKTLVEPARIEAFGASLAYHHRRLAAGLALGFGEHDAAARNLLPALLTRGPVATGRALDRDLWLADEHALDAALHWIDAAGRLPRAGHLTSPIPMPLPVFGVEDRELRDAMLAVGLRVWTEGGVDPADVERVLWTLTHAVSRGDVSHWRAALPRLEAVSAWLAGRLLGHAAREQRSHGDSALLVVVILDACARWVCEGFSDVDRLARILADRWRSAVRADDEWDREDSDRDQLVIRLSEGRIPRFLALLRQRPASRRYAWRALEGWRLVEAHATAHAWVSACVDRAGLVGRVMHLLERMALMAQLDPGLTAARFFAPLDQSPDTTHAWPAWVPQDMAGVLGQIARAHTLAGAPGTLPGNLGRLVDRSDTDRREVAFLRDRAASQSAPRAERERLAKLDRLINDADAHAADLCAALSKALPKQLALSGLAALETLARHDLDTRWRHILGGSSASLDGPQWDNALHMLQHVAHNRRILVRLLRHAVRGDRAWMRALGPNRTFLDGLSTAGLRPDDWLAPRSLVLPRPHGPLTAYAATDPLDVLQMGSLFGTCLSAGGINAHAAVAAAVEVNKRVLYVTDGAGRVLGRQLLALTPAGALIGFRAYGAASDAPERHGVWVKLALELLALEIARASGARLMTATRAAAYLYGADADSLMLFCRGYIDEHEPFDWWIDALAAAPPSAADDRTRVRSWLEDTAGPGPAASADDCRAWTWASCRALLWLGGDTPSLTEDLGARLGLDEGQRSLLVNAGVGQAAR